MKKIAKEKFENNLDNLLLNNSSNPKIYWKIMKMLIKSNKGNYCIPHSGMQTIGLRISLYQKFAELLQRIRRTFQQQFSQQNAL
jgi:hypothetical protein